MSFSQRDPFFGDVPQSVHLPETPLTGVLVQLRFPEIFSISKREYIADFQEKIRKSYPQHTHEEGLQISFGPEGPQPSKVPTWRFLDTKSQWRVTLTTSFLSLETRAYTTRSDFADRTSALAKALQNTIEPGFLTRLGIRYVDRIHGDQFKGLDQYIRPEMLGVYQPDLRDRIERTVSELHAGTDCGEISVRWGFMPPNQTHEPNLMPAISVPSWFLDIDTYQDFREPIELHANDVQKKTMELATRSHGFFRWATNDEFLRSYGGEV